MILKILSAQRLGYCCEMWTILDIIACVETFFTKCSWLSPSALGLLSLYVINKIAAMVLI